jgi:hypothetical protein
MRYEYEIEPRPLDIGGGWHLRLLDHGTVVGEGDYPLSVFAEEGCRKEVEKLAYLTADQDGVLWVARQLSA